MSKRWNLFISVSLSLLAFNQQVLSAELPTYLMQPRAGRSIELQRHAPTLEEMIHRAPYPSANQQPIPLHGVRVVGLESKTVDTLGFNYFIVVDNTKYQRMSDIYKDTRLSGKSNFVTTDSIIHPYLAFTNRVVADVSLKQIKPDLLALLDAMQQVSLADYKEADDAEVREDIARNIAYLAVGIKLLKPDYQLPQIGNAAEMAESDLRSIFAAKPAVSAIFTRKEDFTLFKPLGWYNADADLQNFYRCRQWLSQVPYPIDDVSNGEEGHATNVFRRSVLLFRSLDDARVLGKPAMEVWTRLLKASALLGTPVDNWHERVLYPTDYKLVFQDRPADLKVTLAALAEPLYRTKLMLAIRRQKPMNLSATSIFELDEAEANGTMANFRLFPIVCQPETRWMHRISKLYPTDKQASASWPIGLLDMYAQGSPMAGNVLSEIMWTLDPLIAKTMPDLQHSVWKRVGASQSQPIDSRSWKILGSYFKPAPEGAPGAVRSDLWGCRKLISAMGGWVDALATIAPPSAAPELQKGNAPAGTEAAGAATAASAADGAAKPPLTAAQASQEAASAVSEEATPRRRSKIPPYHLLEPSLEAYRQLSADAQRMQAELSAAHYLSEEHKQRFGDFARLFARLERIADLEIRGNRLGVMDQRLLATIDQILDRVDVPLPSVVSFESVAMKKAEEGRPRGNVFERPVLLAKDHASNIPRLPESHHPSHATAPKAAANSAGHAAKPGTKTATKPAAHAPIALNSKSHVYSGSASMEEDASAPPVGFNLAVGRPGLLYIIYQNPHSMEWTLGRGAVYTYYEMPAPPLTTSMWEHKIDAGFAKPLNWTGKFEIVQQVPAGTTRTAATGRPH